MTLLRWIESPARWLALATLLLTPLVAQAQGDVVLTSAGTIAHPSATAPAPVPLVPSVVDLAKSKAPKDTYRYLARSGRDPFVAPAQARSGGQESTADLPILQRIEVERFRLIGTVTLGKKYKAMVSTEDGKGYSLQVGTRIGVNKGRVRRITGDSVIVEEYKTDVFGERKRYETVMALRPGEVLP